MKELHEKLRDLREDHDLKQCTVADYLGVAQQSYSNYENGRREIPSYMLVKLAQLYQVSTDYLLNSNAAYAGNVDMNSHYFGKVTLHDMVYQLQRLDKDARRDLVHYVYFLHQKNQYSELYHTSL